ncbi:hypothetical protein R20943_03161 [Paraburkholderia aspalathi]|nr:hypothetical protein R20943_03161 [Paraburkholderia aspalathi]
MLILSCELACFGVDNASFAFTDVALSGKWAQLSDLVGESAAASEEQSRRIEVASPVRTVF